MLICVSNQISSREGFAMETNVEKGMWLSKFFCGGGRGLECIALWSHVTIAVDSRPLSGLVG